MQICNKCILPDTFPGISFDNEGICNFCRDFKGEKALNEEKAEYCAKFQELIKQVNEKAKAIVIAVSHNIFKRNLTFDALKRHLANKKSKGVLVDVKGIFDRQTFQNSGLLYWRL